MLSLISVFLYRKYEIVVVVPTFGPHGLAYEINNTKNVMITSTFITMFKRHRFKGTGFKGTQVWV